MFKKLVSRILALTVSTSIVLGSSVTNKTFAEDYKAYLDPKTSVDKRVEDLLSRMTLQQKVAQMTQAERLTATEEDVTNYELGSILSGGGSTPTNNTAEGWANMIDGFQAAALKGTLGIPLLYGVDAVHGHNNVTGTTIFPHNIGLGATGNAELVKKIAQAIAQEVRASGVNWTFAPTLAIPQNERWGRTYEGFSEDTDLVTIMADAYVRGLQGDNPEKTLLRGDKVIATAKHYIGEGITVDGANKGNVVMDETEFEKVLQDELLPPYVKAIEDGVRTVMVSYNSVNGVKCHANGYLVNEVLKERLGFKGIVVSDWEGIGEINASNTREKIKLAINAGVDMAMVPNSWKEFITTVIDLVNNNEISMTRIDDAVSRILKVKFELGLFEDPYSQRDLLSTVGSDEHRDLARQAVRESLVLLKNENDIISSLKDKKNILVAGKSANDIGIQCGGWTVSWQGSSGNITTGTTILQGIENSVGSDVKVNYNKNGRASASNDVAILVLGEKPYAESNGDVTADKLKLDAEDLATLSNLKATNPNIPVIAVLVTGRPITITEQLKDFDAIVAAWLPGTEGEGVSDVLFGDYDFTGKLTYTWPWYASEIQQKFEEGKALFSYGYGLKKGETYDIPAAPTVPGDNDTKYTTVPSTGTTKIEIESCFEQQGFTPEGTADEGGGSDFGWTDAGDWTKHYINIESDGKYEISFRVASPDGSSKAAQLYKDDILLTTVDAPKTGGWQNWQNAVGTVNLKAGKQILRFQAGAGGFNINYYTLTRIGDYEEVPTEPEIPPTTSNNVIEEGAVDVWMSSSEQSQSMDWYNSPKEITNKLSQKPSIDIVSVDNSTTTTINVYPSKEYQNFLGMGTSLEESTINNLAKMDSDVRAKFIRDLIDPVNGAGMTLMRLTVGTSDFTGQKFYTYYDNWPQDSERDWQNLTGKGFSIQKDIDYKIVETIQQLLSIADELGVRDEIKIFASSWTPPGWMKEETASSKSYKNNELLIKGGQLNDNYIGDLAKYYVRYLEEYSKLGINIYAMTLQNEPELEIDYPSCHMTTTQEAKLAKAIKDEVAKSTVLATKNVNPKLWAFDHNFDSSITFMNSAFSSTDGYNSIDGVAFHDYGGQPTAMTQMHNLYPDKTMNLTERSVWGTAGADRIIQYFRNYAESYNSWVTMLDSNIAPEQWVGTPDPTTFVQDAADRNNYWATPEFYISGQFSKFIRPGFVRIDSDYGSTDSVTNVAFKNPETGEIILVVVNQTAKTQNFKIVSNGTQINGAIPGKNVATYTWKPVENIKKIPTTINASDFVASNDVRVDGDHIGYLHSGSYVDYIINVSETGLYDVKFNIASDADNYKKIDIMEGNKVLNSVEVTKTWNWGNYQDMKNTVRFDSAGTQRIRMYITGGEFNIKNITIEKAKEVNNLPGKVLAKDFINAQAIVVGGDKIEYLDKDDFIEYKVNVAEAGEYNFILKAASQNTASEFDIYSDNEFITTISLDNTSDWNNFTEQIRKINLKAGMQTLKFVVKEGFNLEWFTVGPAVDAWAPYEIKEEHTEGTIIYATLTDGTFVSNLDKANWILENLPEGIDFKVERNSDNVAKITLIGSANYDFDIDKSVTVSISAKELSGYSDKSYSVEDTFVIKGIDDKESIALDKTEMPMNTDSITATISGGTFNNSNLSKISLAGAMVEEGYVSIKSIEQIDNNNVKINLQWIKPYYEDLQLTVNVPTEAFSDSNSDVALTKSIICKGSTTLPTEITLANSVVNLQEKDAYRNKGSLASNVKVGNRVDYFLDVKEAGEYTISYRVWNNSGISNALKISGGLGTAISANLASLSFAKFWNYEQGVKDTIYLQEGQQTLRFEANGTDFEIHSITIEKKNAPQSINPSKNGDVTVIKGDSLYGGSREYPYGIENNGENIGFIVRGSYLDYSVNVEKPGMYYISYLYATDSGSRPTAILKSVVNGQASELGKTVLDRTGGWGTYTNSAKTVVKLSVGEQTLRVFDDVDGFNYKQINLEYINDTTAPVFYTSESKIIELGSILTNATLIKALGLKVIDNIEGDITNNATFDTSKLDVTKIGDNVVTVRVEDFNGNVAEENFTVHVAYDVNAPEITAHNGYIGINSVFNATKDLGIKVVDDKDGDITSKAVITEAVDTTVAGIYRVKIVATDNSGNKSEKYVMVRVLEIAVILAQDVTINVGDSFEVMAGVSAKNIDGSDITNKIKIESNNVITEVAGAYKVVYSVVDSENEKVTLERNVIVKAKDVVVPPVVGQGEIVTLDLTLNVGDAFNPLNGVTAKDFDGTDLTSKITVASNNVDTTKAGIYKVVYSVVDSENNTITKERKVTVNSVEVPVTPEPITQITDENGNKVILVSTISDINANTVIDLGNVTSKISLEINDISALTNGTGSITLNSSTGTIKLPFSIFDKNIINDGSRIVFNFEKLDDTTLTNGLKAVNKVFSFTLSVISGDSKIAVTNFNSGKVEISLTLSEDELKNLDKSKLGVFYYNEGTKQFESVDSSIEGNKITFSTPHFSKYIVAEMNTTTNTVTTLPNTGGSVNSLTIIFLGMLLACSGIILLRKRNNIA